MWQVPSPQPSSERSRSTMSSGRLAGEATTVVAAKVVATVGIVRRRTPTTRSGARAALRAQTSATIEVRTAIPTDSGKRSAKER